MLTALALVLFGRFALPPPVVSAPPPNTMNVRLHEPPQVLCTLRVLQVDPRLDAGIVRSRAEDIDPGMVVRSRCADPDRDLLR
jgi:hypothetical protein